MLKILCIHGVSTDEDTEWETEWVNAIAFATQEANVTLPALDVARLDYNHLFVDPRFEAGGLAYLNAFTQLLASAVKHSFTGIFGGKTVSKDALTDSGFLASRAGMVAQWVTYNRLRAELRDLLRRKIQDTQPQLILAHSLGSLIAYDLLSEPGSEALMQGRVLLTFGSQIGNPAVQSTFRGRLEPLATGHWYHLYNAEDRIFTYPLAHLQTFQGAARFEQVDTPFEHETINHAGERYLSDNDAVVRLWPALGARLDPALPKAAADRDAALASLLPVAPRVLRKTHQRRALLVGINEYPVEDNRLSGCVNDTFLMSALLQERGFPPETIRVLLDERATRRAMLERIEWLLEGVRPGDERVLFFSGHGAQVPTYNAEGEADLKMETLVTWDFDWKDNLGISDADLVQLYANLPYDARFVIVLDCCHSGGIGRAGGVAVRGIDPPDDVRHRAIAWDPVDRLWLPRRKGTLERMMEPGTDAETMQRYIGRDGDLVRIGRATPYWTDPEQLADLTERRMGHKGAYSPVVLSACREDQYAYEYRDGAASYGAMTFIIDKELRAGSGELSLLQLKEFCDAQFQKLGLQQTLAPHFPKAQDGAFPGDAASMRRFAEQRAQRITVQAVGR
jgi:hypothetical protein